MMRNLIPRIAAVNDLSGFGRCSLAVVMPVLSAMGMQVCPIPTAVLSTHTGGFEGYTFVDLTHTMADYFGHWHSLGLGFDCMFSGFLGAKAQIDIILRFIDEFGMDERLVVVDPVFADNGRLYPTFAPEFVAHMRRLVGRAHIITPNITEAAFLLDRNCPGVLSGDEAKQWLLALAQLGPRTVVVTSTPLRDAKSCVVAYSRDDGRFWKVSCDYIPTEYPGTGDIFTSVMTGAILEGDSLPVAVNRAVNFVSLAIRTTFGYNSAPREGVLFEKVLHTLTVPSGDIRYELL